METHAVLGDLTLFQSYLEPIDLTFNQYLLAGRQPLLVHTGDRELSGRLAERLVPLLQGRPLAYIFISHFESDECGGLTSWLERFPGARPVCSAVTARQLRGFGLAADALIGKPGEALETEDYRLEYVAYPSEMHLWEGLLAFETRRRLLFSADLFIRRGAVRPAVQPMSWEEEIGRIGPLQVPSPEARDALQQSLRGLPVDFVAPGHGPFLEREQVRRPAGS